MSLRPIEFNSFQAILATKNELDQSSYHNLIIGTDGLTYTMPDVANLSSDQLKNSDLKFLVKNGKNLTLREVHLAIKNKSSSLNNLVKNTQLAFSLQNLKNHRVESCAIDKQQLVYPAVTRCGHTMEYGSLSHWLFNHAQCPVCAKELDTSGFARNKSLQQLNQIMFMRRQLRLSKLDGEKYKALKKEEVEELRNRVNSIPVVQVDLRELTIKALNINNSIPKLKNLSNNQLDAGIEKYEFRQNIYSYRKKFENALVAVTGILFVACATAAITIVFALNPLWPVAIGLAVMTGLCVGVLTLSNRIIKEPKKDYPAKIERNKLLKQKDVVYEKYNFYQKLPQKQQEMRSEYLDSKLFKPKKKLKKAPQANESVKNEAVEAQERSPCIYTLM